MGGIGSLGGKVIAFARETGISRVIYDFTRTAFPRDERFGLTAQLRRAAYSVASNIVEGYAYSPNALD